MIFNQLIKWIIDKTICQYLIGYGQSEESLLKQLNFDLVIYQVFRPLESVLKLCEQKLQNSQQYENFKNQCIQLARLSFQDQMIFQFSHSMIALGVLNQSNKKLQIFSNLFQQLSINLTDQQEKQLDNIEQELRNMENKNLQDEYTERKAIQKMIHEVQKLHKTKVASPGFQKPMENPILMRLSSQQQKKSEQASEQQIKKIKTDSND